jgi:hypothetical protein
MPKSYEVIRDKFLRMGDSTKEAEKRAAMIWNGKIRKPGEAAMGPNWDQRNAALQEKKGGKR